MPDTFPEPRVDWTLDPDRALLIVHDMQDYFLRSYCRDTSPATDLMSNVLALREACAELKIPVIYSRQPGGQTLAERGLLADFWGSGIGPALADTAIPDAIAPSADDRMLTKRRYSAFYGTRLEQLLADERRNQIIICGVYAHIGVYFTAQDALNRNIKTFIAADAVASFNREFHDIALRWATDLLAVVVSTRSINTALREAHVSTSHHCP
ncbi:isochorismatase family protein [Nonomuraea sp. NPDC049784]|uniref:isochorismatase family protein n=1 Tax=Nonomuraea sp. NPDC049784 TaxID=3154361 RepID=UPI0033E18369